MALLTVLEKLQLKDEKNILVQGLPSSIEKQFVKLNFAKSVTPLLRSRSIDFALVFAVSKAQLTGILQDVVPALHENGKLWVAHPKTTSKIASDLCRDCTWDIITSIGFDPIDFVELDNTWNAVHFKKQEVIKIKKQAMPVGTSDFKTVAANRSTELNTAFSKKTKAATALS
ncbi:hypothetical protein BH11BAC4_BH11BAC4_17000 [soil metagenome]